MRERKETSHNTEERRNGKDKGKDVITNQGQFGSWMVVTKQRRTKRQSVDKEENGAKCKGGREGEENVGERTRYEVLSHHSLNEHDIHGTSNGIDVTTKETSQIPTKAFLSGSDMRKAKARASQDKGPLPVSSNQSSTPPLEHQPMEVSEGTIVMETPLEHMEVSMQVEPSDPGESNFSGSELDNIIAQGTATVMAWNEEKAPEGEDIDMA
ncbi:hypothetical protein PIB30_041353 [Stylosanthes scabra]|uniref:Uncharacterized protein n=1 Tax=Stylosanthes scabra TaxID=79078 RepID=A0ABU6YFC3_9FABA|nr:hypothetical protein [Stylosanthes scabra]